MRALQRLEHQLQRIDLRWEVIETTACIVCADQQTGFLSVLGSTRAAFGELATELVERIAAAHLANRQRDLASKAQVAIDILTRNLFERTADVGFIATDGPLVDFVRAPQATDAAALRARLVEYRAKYSVYNDIVLLDRQAQPLLRLAPGDDAQAAPPPWWQEAMAQSGWIERHEASAFFPGAGDVLIYAHRIVSAQGAACGAVVLRFDLASELALLFGDLQDVQRRIALVFIDADGRIVASNKPSEFALGEVLAHAELNASATVFNHHGQDYLAQTRRTRGYQGYRGLPWTAAALIRLDAAFRDAGGGADATDAADPADASEAGEIDTDDARLQQIVTQARAVQDGLTRVIWNGKLADAQSAAGNSLHAVFDQIGQTGSLTTALFDGAIGELRQLLMAGRRAEMHAHAQLAANIMDRNLYERANDCRWWALSDELAAVLAELDVGADPTRRAAATREAERVLAHLNDLYTVYRRVALFDRTGRVIAVSRDADALPADIFIDPALLQRVLTLQGTQAYAVSPMAPSALTDGEPTYLYCAALRAPGGGAGIGGIALAFESAGEFRAMLRDAAPDPAEAQAFFVDSSRRVVASLDDAVPVGAALPFDLPTADAGTALVRWQEHEYLVGIAPSTGYREFKRSDGYREPITALQLTRVRRSAHPATHLLLPRAAGASAAGARRYGVVACGNLVLAIAGADVIEAITAERLVTVGGGPHFAGMLEHPHAAQSVVVAIDARRLSGQVPLAQPRSAVAVVVRSQGRHLALLVDRLLGVIERDNCQAPPDAVSRHAGWITGVISDAAVGLPLVYVIDPNRFDSTFAPMPANAFALV